jgi:hypothetical protein
MTSARVHTTFDRRNMDEYGPLLELNICKIGTRLAQLKCHFLAIFKDTVPPQNEETRQVYSLQANLSRPRPSGTVAEVTISM